LLKEFKEYKFPVLVNCGVFTEGTDIPTIDCVVVARPTLSSVLMHQMIGRGLRKVEGKVNLYLLSYIEI
jgi:ATP-dependent helicase IRC3